MDLLVEQRNETSVTLLDVNSEYLYLICGQMLWRLENIFQKMNDIKNADLRQGSGFECFELNSTSCLPNVTPFRFSKSDVMEYFENIFYM